MSDTDKFRGARIEYHILQSFPVTCLNRDDVGAPKTAMIGGALRARVSSQCWKRQVRMALHEFGVKIGVRTKKISELLAKAMEAGGAASEQAKQCADKVAEALSDNTLCFFSQSEANAIADFAREHDYDVSAMVIDKKKGLTSELKKVVKKKFNPALDGLDIALFGRMIAQAPDMNMQAAASFAHAITTHRASNEVDFFTALDDLKDEPGSGHMGSLEYNSGTYYRYISLDLGVLAENIGQENVAEAVKNFTRALYAAVPSARQTTQTGLRPWDYARILVRKGQGMQASFDEPVHHDNGYLKPSIEALNRQLQTSQELAASLYGKIADYAYGDDKKASIDDIIDNLAADVRRIEQSAEKASA